jgi:hypothetical protein
MTSAGEAAGLKGEAEGWCPQRSTTTDERTTWTVLLGRGGSFLAVPIGRGRVYCYWVLAQTHRRDRTRNLPPALRNLVLRRWGRNIFHANYRPLLELP